MTDLVREQAVALLGETMMISNLFIFPPGRRVVTVTGVTADRLIVTPLGERERWAFPFDKLSIQEIGAT